MAPSSAQPEPPTWNMAMADSKRSLSSERAGLPLRQHGRFGESRGAGGVLEHEYALRPNLLFPFPKARNRNRIAAIEQALIARATLNLAAYQHHLLQLRH